MQLYVGAPFTGPSLNPIMAFSWDWHYRQHGTLEHYVVFWAAPFLGAVIAGVLYKWVDWSWGLLVQKF